MVTLAQMGLIDEILDASGMIDCNTRGFPSTTNGLGTDADGARRKESWNCASIIGVTIVSAQMLILKFSLPFINVLASPTVLEPVTKKL
jgi:hypothetical protein